MRKSLLLSLAFVPGFLFAQEENEPKDWGTLSGNFQFDGQYYVRDTKLDPSGEFYPDEQFLGQGFANFNYIRGNFRAGIRYENYQNPLLGFPPGYRGQGITYRYVQFVKNGLDVTVGNFYEQFGSGMIFRSYEVRNLGFDNMMDGVRLKFTPIKGITFKGVIGKQRKYFEKSEGIVRGLDGEFRLNDIFSGFSDSKTRITFGGSFVSKYQPANDPFLNLPENVGAGAGRISLSRGKISVDAEYVYKVNDPSEDNGYIFRPGQGLLVNFTYATRGFGLIFSAKRIDNMSFRSERGAQQNDVLINFLPPTTKFHTYALPALYPYQTVLNGEQGFQTELTYLFPRGSILGGKYGTNLAVNFAYAGSIYKDPIPKTDTLNYVKNGYNTEWFKQGQINYYQDFNIEVKKKINKNLKIIATYYNMVYNFATLQDGVKDETLLTDPEARDYLYINAGVLEIQYKLDSRHFIRSEIQGLFVTQDKGVDVADNRGDLAMILVEYSVSPHWSFGVQDIYNYGNPDPDRRLHYPLGSVTYTEGTTRVQVTYGRQQQGIFCVGGVCRVVPPSNGIALSVTTNF